MHEVESDEDWKVRHPLSSRGFPFLIFHCPYSRLARHPSCLIPRFLVQHRAGNDSPHSIDDGFASVVDDEVETFGATLL